MMSNPYERTRDESASVLGPTLKFKGELTAEEDLLIQGRVEGTIRHTSSLTIGDSGHVKADVVAEYIAVDGRVEGDLHGSTSVKIRESAKIDGNIISPNVSLVEGATFNGKIDMESDPAVRAAPKPERKKGSEDGSKAKAVVEQKEEPAAEKVVATGKSSQVDKKSADAA
jgi:cytoskeletal protein CcmA (bactofilin family)